VASIAALRRLNPKRSPSFEEEEQTKRLCMG